MPLPAISVAGLGKRYVLRHFRRHDTLRDTIADGVRRLFRPRPDTSTEDFWALRDVSFDVPRGEVIGLIGRNGAGKSTLLKILSRITEPTTGRAVIRGRVASLLEVGTGFHPELTGRENIFLNGAILGMTRAEIARKFDEIVAFAEVERFLDTPVKHYSSGMYVRLAFAVAAHLEPEILIVDEVLAVGDAAFQRKCLRKMDDVTRREGRTILFVSHQLASIRQLCSRVLLFDQGRLVADADVGTGLSQYLSGLESPDATAARPAFGPELSLAALELEPAPVTVFADLRVALRLEARRACRIAELSLLIQNDSGQQVARADLRPRRRPCELPADGSLELRPVLRRVALVPGNYAVGLSVRTDEDAAEHRSLRVIEVRPAVGSPDASPGGDAGTVALDVQFEGLTGTGDPS